MTSEPMQAFIDFLLLELHTIFFPSHWLLFHITIIKTMIIGERGMNPIPMAITNHWREID